MKALIAIMFAIGSAAAAGSGPYLPSGWKPEGPAFYLPSELQRQSDNPLKETLFQESEASGSDALREYGPPKLDESPLQVTNQGLPDVITEQTFLVVEAKSALDGAVQSVAIEETSHTEVNEDQPSAFIETITATETAEAVSDEKTIVSDAPTSEATLEANIFEVEPTIDAGSLEVQPTFEASVSDVQSTFEASVPEVQSTFEASVLEVQPTLVAGVSDVQPTLEASVSDVQPTLEASVSDVQPTLEASVSEAQPTFEASVPEDQPTEASVIDVQPTIDANILEVQPTLADNILEIQPTLEGRALDVEQPEVKSTEEKTETAENLDEFAPIVVEEVVKDNVAGVRNIADALEKLEKEIKAVEVQAIEGLTEIKVTQDTSGSLEQAPEGFLEYGPPGFREYGPPKGEDLLRSALVQAASTDAIDNNEVRRRRYSPKFRSSKKAH